MSFHVDEEIASQPECWERAAALAGTVRAALPKDGERVAFVGCGTSWFMSQVIAHWRDASGLGESDAYTAAEFNHGRSYDRVVALSRSGTTTEVLDLLRTLAGRVPSVAVLGDLDTPLAEVADAVVDLSFADEKSVVQTRFATSALALFRAAFGVDLAPIIAQAREALETELPAEWAAAEQISFLGQGWGIGIAHEAALKFRESSSSWAESYPAFDYRHGPISIAAPGRVVWMFGDPPAGLAADVTAIGAEFVDSERDPMADLVAAQRLAIARARHLGLNPDLPRNLSRSVVLSDS
ncbi:MAG: SIS domain-containing protein [Propionibacteriaceae bacterium]